MNQLPYLLYAAGSHTLAQELRPWLSLENYPFTSRIRQYEPWVHKTDTSAYDVYTMQSDIQVGEHVTRPAYLKVSLWRAGGGNNFPLRPTREQLRNPNETHV